MDLYAILQKAWQLLWKYKTLWLFGAVLALVEPHLIKPGPWLEDEDSNTWTRIKISDRVTYQMPGIDMTIDLSATGGKIIVLPDTSDWQEVQELVDVIEKELSIHLQPILIEIILILAFSLLLGTIVRYITETALIRMVDETEQSGRRLNVWQGLRRGLSAGAWRVFLLDLVAGVLLALVFAILFGLAAAPILVAIGSSEGALITAGVGTTGLLVLVIYLWLAATIVLSTVLQTIRRACVLENQGLLDSIRMGARMTKHHLKVIAPLWLIWVSLQLIWIPIVVLAMLVLAPITLLTTLTGTFLAGIPAALVAGITCLFMDGATPWIMGALAGLPIFFVVMISPLLFINGLLEVYLSSIWTLTYRELKAMEIAASSHMPLVQAPGIAD